MFPRGSTLSIKFSLLEKFAYMVIYMYHRIDQDILSRKKSHKDTPISVLFWTFLLGKLINSVDLQGKHVISSGPSSAAAEIIVDIYRYTYHLNKSLQDFVQRKLDKFEIKLIFLSSYVIVVHIIAVFLLFCVLTVINISEMHAKLAVSYYSFIYRK